MTTRIVMLLLLVSTVFNMRLARAETNDMERIRAMLVSAATKAESIGCRNVDVLADNYRGLRNSAKFSELQDLETDLPHLWRKALANMSSLAHSDMEKAVLLYSCGGLSSTDYIDLLKEAVTLVESGFLDREIFYDIQTPFAETSDAWAVLTKNPENVTVREIITKAKAIFQDQPERVAMYDRILSGESRRKLEQFEASMREESTPDSNLNQGPRTPKPIMQGVPTGEAAAKMKSRLALPAVAGLLALLACASVWISRKKR